MKGYLIDPVNKSVTQVEVGEGLKPIYELTKCKLVTCVGLNAKHDTVYVNDEGLIDGTAQTYGMFVLTGSLRAVPLAGYGLVLGSDEWGGSGDVKATLEEVKAMVTFPSMGEIQRRAMAGEFD